MDKISDTREKIVHLENFKQIQFTIEIKSSAS